MVNWNMFKVKHNNREQWAFEELSYLLFCSEFNNRVGIFRYKNQTGIETEPIVREGIVYGFQSKYYTTPISQNKTDIIDSIQKAKSKNNNLNKILLYTNQELSESTKKNKKKPEYQIDIENEAQKFDIAIDWRVPSHFEVQLTRPENNYIYDIFFGDSGFDQDFFINQIEREIKNLGPRFNEILNFQLPIAKIFNSISKKSEYCQNIIAKTDKWLTEKGYRKLNDNTLISEIETELGKLQQELKDWTIDFQQLNLVESEITLLQLIEQVKTFNKKISEKQHELWNKQCTEKEKGNKFEAELSRLREIQNLNDELIESIDNLNINLANHPILIIQGDAGCGKSHLLGDVATQRKNQDLPTILLMGTNFNNTTIEHNILEKLNLTCNFNDFLKNLNNIGLLINSRVLILIDAINEGAGTDLWKNQIAGFIHEVAKYPAIGLVLTIRSTYFHDIIPNDFSTNTNITLVTHEGFKGNEYEALKLFCDFHGLKLPNFPILNPEYSNPLLLHLICESVKNSPEKSFPKGFNGINQIYNSYKNSLNQKFGQKRNEYRNRNIVSSAINKFSTALFKTKYGQMECEDAFSLFDIEFPQFPNLLSDLIEESVFIKTRYEYSDPPKDLISFSYQKLGDFFMAEELVKSYKTKDELKDAFENNSTFKKITEKYQWQYEGVVEVFAVLLPELYNVEIIDFVKFFINKNNKILNNYTEYQITKYLIDSLKWRSVNSINDKKIRSWLSKHFGNNRYRFEEYLLTLIELTAIPNHPFNSDRLHNILIDCTMPNRDSFWQRFLLYYSGKDDNNIAFPLRRLIDWAWTSNISANTDAETARLVAQTLAWALASTKVKLRDQTTKALVNLLEQQPNVLIKTLKAFETVDDLYIIERLYAVAYGCILRTEKDESIKTIAQYIYDTIFKNGNPPMHILIRDYARNVIEYAIYRNVELDIDAKLIRPPYKSQCNYTPISNEKLDEKYEPKDDKGHFGKEEWGKGAILRSMVTEYGRGRCRYGDFGRYTFQSSLRNFALPNKLNVDLLSNLAVEWIFEKYGYDIKLHGEYDNLTQHHYEGRNRANVERIGKKYQWIALYEILAMVADNFKMKDGWGNDAKYTFYKGAWQNFLRDIDPAYITKNKDENEDDGILIKQSIKNWWDDMEYNNWNCPDAEWVETIEDLIDPKQVIEKKDVNGVEWLHLQHFVKWDEPKKIGIERYEGRRKQICYIIQGLLVKKSDKRKIINYLKKQNFWGRWLPENRDDYSHLINREKFWSPAYLDTYENDKRIWDTIENTNYKVIVTTESAKGRIESDQSGANQSYNIPCQYIFEEMRLQYAPIDGNLKNSKDEIIVMNSNPSSVLMRKKDLVQFLEDNNFDIIWTILGEKYSFIDSTNKDSYFKVPCGIYYLENKELAGELKMYYRD